MQKALEAMDAMQEIIAALHQEIYRPVGESVLARLEQRDAEADNFLEISFREMWKNEDELADVLDFYFYHSSIFTRISLDHVQSFEESF